MSNQDSSAKLDNESPLLDVVSGNNGGLCT